MHISSLKSPFWLFYTNNVEKKIKFYLFSTLFQFLGIFFIVVTILFYIIGFL